MSDPLLQIRNHHAVSSGDPPIVISDDPDLYIGYFENALGEQWVFTRNRKTDEAILRSGDIGWNTKHTVSADGNVGSLVLRDDEMAWLRACWIAATSA